MKLFSTLLLAITATAVSYAQPIYRLNNILWEYHDTASFKPYADIRFTYSGNRPGVFSNADEIERLIIETPVKDSLLRPIAGLQYDTARYTQLNDYRGRPELVAAQKLDNTGQIHYYTLYSWNWVKEQYDYLRADKLIYNAGLLSMNLRMHGDIDTTTYHYNTNGLPDSIEYTYPRQKEIFIYNASGNLAEKIIITPTDTPAHIYYNYSPLSWLHSVINMRGTDDTAQANYFSYNVEGDMEGELERISFAPNFPLINNTWKLHSYNNHNRIKTEIWLHDSKDPAIWNYDIQVYYEYNSYGLIETALLQSFNKYGVPAMYTDVRRFRFNYELTWPVSIAAQPANTSTIQLYPNPAGEILTFRIGMKTAQPFTASITDMQGRVLMQWKEAAAKEYTRTIPTAALPAGTYVLRVDGEGLEQTKMFSVR